MIVKNEEKELARCLSQVTGFSDEIILVDTGSTDHTKEIAKTFTDLVYDFTWIDDFSAARNFSFSKATKEYILWLDADDFISSENQAKIMQLKETLKKNHKGVYMPYNHTENGALITSFPRLRIVRRDAGFVWRDRIHETLESNSVKPNEFLNCDIAISQEIKPRGTTTRYLEILGNIVAEGNADLRTLQLYASELEKHGQKEKSIEIFEQYFQNGGLKDIDCLMATVQLGTLYEQTEQYDKALQLYSDSMPYCGERSEYCCSLGNFYFEIAGDIEEAVFWYRAALRCPYPKNTVILERFYYYVPQFRLYQIFESIGDKKSAESHLLLALEEMKKLESKSR